MINWNRRLFIQEVTTVRVKVRVKVQELEWGGGNSKLPVPAALLAEGFPQGSQGAKGLDTKILIV